MAGISNIIFVHGAWANSSAWVKVLPLVEAAGLTATAVSLPLTSLADDVGAVKRAIDLTEGPLLLVGHSYGGVVISEVGTDPKVAGLVYIAAFAPDVGESAKSLSASGPPTMLIDVIRPDGHGFIKMTRRGFDEVIAQDLPSDERAIMFSTQTPLSGASIGGVVTAPAWKDQVSWYLLASEDRAVHPELQKTMAARIGATTVVVEASHAPMLSQPKAVADLVIRATG